MAEQTFALNTNQKAERKLYALYVNVGTSESPEWEILGAGVEESTLELNAEVESVTDVLGITETSVKKFEESQSFDPNTIRGGQKLNAKLLDIVRRRAYDELSQFEILRVWGILKDTNKYKAELDRGCAIVPQSIGGSSYIDMPIDITFSGDRTFGTTNVIKQTASTPIVFTPDSASE